MATTQQKPKPTEAQRLIAVYEKDGMSLVEIAFRAHVSLNSIIRWRQGVKPLAAHLIALRAVKSK